MEGLLAILKLVFLAALYLFLWRVVAVVLREMKPATAAVDPAPVVTPPVSSPAPGSAVVLPKGTVGLVILEPAARAGELIPVAGELTIGRAPGCGIAFPDDGTLSSLHARVAPTRKGVIVEDLGSTNGTVVNDAPITTATTAKRGAQIRCGGATFEVVT